MGHLLRTALIWLVAVAVPVQGMAAVAMTHCGPAHSGAQAAQPKLLALPDAPQIAHEEHTGHGHASHLAPDAAVQGDNGQNATSPDVSGTAQAAKAIDPAKVAKATYQKCSACASCCAGLALFSTVAMPPTIDAARDVTVLSLSEAASVVIDGPERPPRTLRG